MEIRLSKSSLEKFRSCQRCFWLEKNLGLKQPDGIRAGVPMGIDRELKHYYDAHRAAGTVPQELIGKIPGGLYDGKRISMDDLRNWRKGLVAVVDGVELSTAMDDLLFNPATGLYNVYDAKSKAKLTDEADTRRYYEVQADAYDLALNENGYKTDGAAYFGYYAPRQPEMNAIGEETADGRMVSWNWHCQVVKIKADPERVKALVRAAAACLRGPLPAPNITRSIVSRGANKGAEKLDGCPVCCYLLEREKFFAAKSAA